jgi:putative hydrolase of the HAD superfamily
MTMIKAVLWDFGGVLTTSPFEAFNRYEREQGLPENFIRGVNATNPDSNAWAQLENSQIDVETFDALFADEAAALGHRVPGIDVLGLLAGDVRPRMVAALKQVKQQYRVACLTNNVKGAGEGPGMARNEAKAAAVAEVMGLFDFVLESSVVGFRKPDPRFYEAALEKAGIDAKEAVFLDDLGINLKTAHAMGMTTIKVVSEEQALADLGAALSLSFS